MSCPTVVTIQPTECIGNSLNTINNNYQALRTSICDNQDQINNLTAFVNTFSRINKLINAQGLINQRGYISGTATTTSNQYTVDRWRVLTVGQNITFSQSQNVTTFTALGDGVEQVVEGLNIESGTYILNWTGNAEARVNGVVRAKGENFSLIGGSDVTVRFAGTFSLPQLEKGTTPSSFEYRPIGTELALCQRYFFKSSDQGGGFDSGSRLIAVLYDTAAPRAFSATYWHPTYMRTAPSVTTSSFTHRGINSSGGTETFSNGTLLSVDAAADKSSIRVKLPNTNNTFGSSTNIFLNANWQWSAEL